MEVVLVISALLVGMVIGGAFVCRAASKETIRWKELSEKHFRMFDLAAAWISIRQNDKELSHYFEKKGYKTVAIYGMSYLGRLLREELRNSSVEVVFGIDRTGQGIGGVDIPVYMPDDDWETVDVIVVTAVDFYGEIKEAIQKKRSIAVISLEDVVLYC
jgi:hypothetical protein